MQEQQRLRECEVWKEMFRKRVRLELVPTTYWAADGDESAAQTVVTSGHVAQRTSTIKQKN